MEYKKLDKSTLGPGLKIPTDLVRATKLRPINDFCNELVIY
jgi:hypothetical protein